MKYKWTQKYRNIEKRNRTIRKANIKQRGDPFSIPILLQYVPPPPPISRSVKDINESELLCIFDAKKCKKEHSIQGGRASYDGIDGMDVMDKFVETKLKQSDTKLGTELKNSDTKNDTLVATKSDTTNTKQIDVNIIQNIEVDIIHEIERIPRNDIDTVFDIPKPPVIITLDSLNDNNLDDDNLNDDNITSNEAYITQITNKINEKIKIKVEPIVNPDEAAETDDTLETLEKIEIQDTTKPPVYKLKNSVLLCSIPIKPQVSKSGKQNGGNNPIQKQSVYEIINVFKSSTGGSCTMTTCKSGTILNAEIQGSTTPVVRIAMNAGAFNAVFADTLFNEFQSNEQCILRVSTTSVPLYDKNNNTKLSEDIMESVNEIYYGLIAANTSGSTTSGPTTSGTTTIGPKIYKYGTMIDAKNKDNVFVYSVIDKLHGDMSSLFNSKGHKLNNPLIPKYEYTEITDIIDKSIDKLYNAGKQCGFLMMDSKSPNVMFINQKSETDPPKDLTDCTVYVIDYDVKFMLNATNPAQSEMYGKINVILFLSYLYFYNITQNRFLHAKPKSNTQKQNDAQTQLDNARIEIIKQVGVYIINKLKSEYYMLEGKAEAPPASEKQYQPKSRLRISNAVSKNRDTLSKDPTCQPPVNFKNIQSAIQYLYFTNNVFRNVSHHYRYAELEILKIRYFTQYKLSLHETVKVQTIQAQPEKAQPEKAQPEKAQPYYIAFFADNSLKNPIFSRPSTREEETHHINCIYLSGKNTKTSCNDKYKNIDVYSINKLCLGVPQSDNSCIKIIKDSQSYADYMKIIIMEYTYTLYMIHISKSTEKQPYISPTGNVEEYLRQIQEQISAIQANIPEKDINTRRKLKQIKLTVDKYLDSLIDNFNMMCNSNTKSEEYYTNLIKATNTLLVATTETDNPNPFIIDDETLNVQQTTIFKALNDIPYIDDLLKNIYIPELNDFDDFDR